MFSLLSQGAHLKAEMLAGKKSAFITVEIRAGPYARVAIFILTKGEPFILYNSKLLRLYCYFNKKTVNKGKVKFLKTHRSEQNWAKGEKTKFNK